MTTIHVGDTTIDRVEENSGPFFPVDVMFPAFNPDAVDNHGSHVFAQHMDLATQTALVSMHTWVLRTVDRDLMVLWDGDYEVDDGFHLEMATGHPPGHSVAWLQSKGERALFAGDSMHSAMQVFEPTWNSAFCLAGEETIATRRRL